MATGINNRESTWVREEVAPVITSIVATELQSHGVFEVTTGQKLRYNCNVVAYSADDVPEIVSQKYETDLLISERFPNGSWAPCLIIELKLGGITSHDALTYSAKAYTHKHVHPYLRYGVIIGDHRNTVPRRLIRHGEHFEFMGVWESRVPTAVEHGPLAKAIREQVMDSRDMRAMIQGGRDHRQSNCHFVGRQQDFSGR